MSPPARERTMAFRRARRDRANRVPSLGGSSGSLLKRSDWLGAHHEGGWSLGHHVDKGHRVLSCFGM